MRPEQILNMIFRRFLNKAVQRGVDTGLRKMSGPEKELTPAERKQQRQARQMAKRARQAARAARRIGRM